MTRQEQKAVKELSEMISKNLKLVAREHGFKVVSDCAYKVLGDFLYEVFLSAPPIRHGTAIRAVVSTKPCVIDKKMTPIRTMIFVRADRTAIGHQVEITYIANITI